MICVTSWAHWALYRVSKLISYLPASLDETPRIGPGRGGSAGRHKQRVVTRFWTHEHISEGGRRAQRYFEVYRDLESPVSTTEEIPRSIHVQ